MMKNKSHKKKSIGWYLDLALNLILLFFGLVLVWILLQVTCIATFKIPSDSMEPALLDGDNILVNKCVMGGRLFNVWDALGDKEVDIYVYPNWAR